MSVLFFALAALGFGFVIFIHELGHFLFAKWAGVKVDVFSIGFGPRIFTRRIGETEYSLSLLPLGGYVRMVGQEDLPEDPNDPATAATAKDPRSFLNATPGWKAAILLAGVLFNLVSSYLILLGLAAYGLPVLRPVIGEVVPEIAASDGTKHPSPAAEMGLRPGDRVLLINGEKVRSFEDLSTGALVAGRQPITMTVQRPGIAEPLMLPATGTVTAAYDYDLGRPVLGLREPLSNRIHSQLATLGDSSWKAGQRVVAIDTEELPEETTGQAVLERLNPSFGKSVTLTLTDRSGTHTPATGMWAGPAGGADCTLGLPTRITALTDGSPAAEAGLHVGDALLAIDGTPITGPGHFYALVRTALDRSSRCAVTFQRPGQAPTTALLTGAETAGVKRLGIAPGLQLSGMLGTLAPAIDGKPSALATAEVKVGETLVDLTPDATDPLAFTMQVVRGGEHLTIPVSAAGVTLAKVERVPGKLAKLFGDQTEDSLATRLSGVRVVAGSAPDGTPSGSPAPGLLQVSTAGGTPRSVDLRPLGVDGVTLLKEVKPGDWLIGLGTGNDGKPAWELVRGAGDTARNLALHGRQPGQPLAFDIEMVPYRLGSVGEAFAIANRAAHTMIWKSLLFIPKFFKPADQGGIDAKKSLQGPIGIFDEMRLRAEYFGFDSFLNLVALVGLNLVLVNLLPIPITDGGQLLFLAIETAIGRPLPPLVRTIAMWIGLGLVVSLMLFVTSLDIVRRL